MTGDIFKRSAQWRWNDANRFKLKAHAAVKLALRHGTLKRGKCEVCSSFRTEAHHDSYLPEHWLVVRWLCRLHHRRLHAAERRKAAA